MIAKIFIISFCVIGYCCTFWEGMIFEKLGDKLDNIFPEYIQKPLYRCFICACFWWGMLIYYLFFWASWKEMFLVVIASMGVNAALSKMFNND